MKTRHFLMMATLAVGMAMTSMMMTSCSKADNPVEELEGTPSSGYYGIPEDMLDLSKLVEANPRTLLLKDGAFVTGRLSVVYDIVVAKGASITLYNVTIKNPNRPDTVSGHWGIKCEGDAVINLLGKNYVEALFPHHPGVQPGPEGTTLTIRGSGSLIAIPYIYLENESDAPGIGAGFNQTVGNIVIESGDITVYGGDESAGIGTSRGSTCGDITICSGSDAVKLYVTKGEYSQYSIGPGIDGKCGTVTIGCTKDSNGNIVGGTTGYISESPFKILKESGSSYYIPDNTNVHPEEGGDNTPVGIPED